MSSEKNLLIIDDETDLLTNLKYILRPYATKVFTATNGLEGLKVLKEQQIHCVVCDIAMPEMNGVEVIKHIRSEGNEVPFIFYTAFGNHDLMREAAKYGAYDFLTKPIFEDLEAVVARGLTEGFHRSTGESNASANHEYQKILEDFLKAEKDLE